MDTETLAALRGSIAKWRAIVEGTGEDKGIDNCPLCLKFNSRYPAKNLGCNGCPVYQRTGQDSCSGTPYDEYLSDKRGTTELAQAELDFLISLLPEADPEAPA